MRFNIPDCNRTLCFRQSVPIMASLPLFKDGSKPQYWLQLGWLSADSLKHQLACNHCRTHGASSSLQAALAAVLVYESCAVRDVCVHHLSERHMDICSVPISI